METYKERDARLFRTLKRIYDGHQWSDESTRTMYDWTCIRCGVKAYAGSPDDRSTGYRAHDSGILYRTCDEQRVSEVMES